MTARLAKSDDPLRAVALSRSGGKCEVCLGEWGDESARRCNAAAESIFILEDGSYRSMCRPCRVRSVGYTAAEQRKRRESFRGAQVGMFPGEENKKR